MLLPNFCETINVSSTYRSLFYLLLIHPHTHLDITVGGGVSMPQKCRLQTMCRTRFLGELKHVFKFFFAEWPRPACFLGSCQLGGCNTFKTLRNKLFGVTAVSTKAA